MSEFVQDDRRACCDEPAMTTLFRYLLVLATLVVVACSGPDTVPGDADVAVDLDRDVGVADTEMSAASDGAMDAVGDVSTFDLGPDSGPGARGHADSIRTAYDGLPSDVTVDTIVWVTVTNGEDEFLYDG